MFFNRTVYGHAVNSVCCANEEAARLVALRVLRGGHRRFGLIGGVANTSTHIERKRAFASELRRHGIAEFLEASGGNTYEGGFNAAKPLLSAADRPEALFCISDIMALGALDAARREMSLSVPGEVSIVGFDDIARRVAELRSDHGPAAGGEDGRRSHRHPARPDSAPAARSRSRSVCRANSSFALGSAWLKSPGFPNQSPRQFRCRISPSALAVFWPVMSYALPDEAVIAGTGRPPSSVTTRSKPIDFSAIWPWS